MSEISKAIRESQLKQANKQLLWDRNKTDSCHNYVYGSGCGKKASKIDLAQVSWHLLGATIVIAVIIILMFLL